MVKKYKSPLTAVEKSCDQWAYGYGQGGVRRTVWQLIKSQRRK